MINPKSTMLTSLGNNNIWSTAVGTRIKRKIKPRPVAILEVQSRS